TKSKRRPRRKPLGHSLSIEPLEPRLALAARSVLSDSFELNLHSGASIGSALTGQRLPAGRVHWFASSQITFQNSAAEGDVVVQQDGTNNVHDALVPYTVGNHIHQFTISARLFPKDAGGSNTNYVEIGLRNDFNLNSFAGDVDGSFALR